MKEGRKEGMNVTGRKVHSVEMQICVAVGPTAS